MAMPNEARRMRLERFREAAALRNTQFQEEGLGSLARFYQENAADYRLKAEEFRKKYEEMQPYWEDVFTKASQAYQINKTSKQLKEAQQEARMLGSSYMEFFNTRNRAKRFQNQYSFTLPQTEQEWAARRDIVSANLIDLDKQLKLLPGMGPTEFAYGKKQDFTFRGIRDREGRLISLSDVLTDTGERKDISSIRGGRAREFAEVKTPYEDYAGQAASYEAQYEAELASLAQRNEERRQRFMNERQQRLSSLQNVQGSYRGATYTEKPL